MKTRIGFVSNSSSSSFLIYGVAIDKSKFSESVLSDSNLDRYGRWDDNYVYVGKSWDEIGMNETRGQFIESIQNEVTRLFGEGYKCSTHEDAWYDG